MYAIVVGGGKVGYYLTKTLQGRGFEVTVIEYDGSKAYKLEDEFGTHVVLGDGSSPQVLERAGAARADIVVAVTGRDEDNFVICQFAKQHFGVAQTIARLNNPKNERVFRELDVAHAVSSTTIIAGLIEMEVASERIAELLRFPSGEMLVVEIDLSPRSAFSGFAVKELELPAGSLLVSIVRGGEIILPKGETRLEAGDRLVALTTLADQQRLKEYLAREASPSPA